MKPRLKIEFSEIELNGEIELPYSKSLVNRWQIISYIANQGFLPKYFLDSDDAKVLNNMLRIVDSARDGVETAVLNCGNTGTAFRFLTSLLAVIPGNWVLTGDSRMEKRPIGQLVDALKMAGANIEYINEVGFPPLKITGKKLVGNKIAIDATKSSQFVSSILMVAPYFQNGLELEVLGETSSQPYIQMTTNLMNLAGVEVDNEGNIYSTERQEYNVQNIEIERDWSAASFFYEMVSMVESSKLVMNGLYRNSSQGDSILPEMFAKLGVETIFTSNGIELRNNGRVEPNINQDFSNYPDLAMPFIVACAAKGVMGKFTGLENLRIKESDRLAVMENLLSKFGFDFRDNGFGEWVLINSCKIGDFEFEAQSIEVETFNDHRVAMSFAPLSILAKTVEIIDPMVVEKSFPRFWDSLSRLGFAIDFA